MEFLLRHRNGDWGVIGTGTQNHNEVALERGYSLHSAYRLHNDDRLWIITKADRTETNLLLPSDWKTLTGREEEGTLF